MKKQLCTPINPKNIFMLRPKKPLCKEFDNEKTLLRLKNSPPPPPIIFLMVRPLEAFSSVYCVMSPDMCW